MQRSVFLVGLVWLCCAFPSFAASPDTQPVPFLSYQDLKALFPPKRPIGDWNSPKVKDYPNQAALIERCRKDLELSTKLNPDPFQRNHRLWPGKLVLTSINKDEDNRIVLFVFSYQSELELDLFIVYYYDPRWDRFVLKTSR